MMICSMLNGTFACVKLDVAGVLTPKYLASHYTDIKHVYTVSHTVGVEEPNSI